MSFFLGGFIFNLKTFVLYENNTKERKCYNAANKKNRRRGTQQLLNEGFSFRWWQIDFLCFEIVLLLISTQRKVFACGLFQRFSSTLQNTSELPFRWPVVLCLLLFARSHTKCIAVSVNASECLHISPRCHSERELRNPIPLNVKLRSSVVDLSVSTQKVPHSPFSELFRQALVKVFFFQTKNRLHLLQSSSYRCWTSTLARQILGMSEIFV